MKIRIRLIINWIYLKFFEEEIINYSFLYNMAYEIHICYIYSHEISLKTITVFLPLIAKQHIMMHVKGPNQKNLPRV